MKLLTENGTAVNPEQIRKLFSSLKQVVVDSFRNDLEKGLFTLKLHTLDHLEEDIYIFGNNKFLDPGTFEN